MKITVVKPKVTLLSATDGSSAMLRTAKSTRLTLTPELHARHMHEQGTEEEARDLDYIARTIKSSWEFVNYHFLIENCSRSFTHQLVRTRTASYAQQTQRTLNMAEGAEFKIVLPEGITPEARDVITFSAQQSINSYEQAVACGAAPEAARAVLPQCTATNILVGCNLRTLAQWCADRGRNPRVQGEYRDIVHQMQSQALLWHPWAAEFLCPSEDMLREELTALVQEGCPDKDTRTKIYKLIEVLR